MLLYKQYLKQKGVSFGTPSSICGCPNTTKTANLADN